MKKKSSISIQLRDATLQDIHTIYQWRNHISIRNVSFNKKKIPFDVHKKWLIKIIESNTHDIYIIEQEDKIPIGVIHLYTQNNNIEISIYLDPKKQGLGYGTQALKYTIKKIKKEKLLIKTITAKIIHNNNPSHHLFKKLGFQADFTQYSYEI